MEAVAAAGTGELAAVGLGLQAALKMRWTGMRRTMGAGGGNKSKGVDGDGEAAALLGGGGRRRDRRKGAGRLAEGI